ncbi:hypothetical protein LCGC14_1057160 [marine sediment metagenome]|uniref:Uncharacterized protein n=1 Tax=marine sediment metagenome TaxID=412755 RepID=A0A0F9MRR9_9ZZZZ
MDAWKICLVNCKVDIEPAIEGREPESSFVNVRALCSQFLTHPVLNLNGLELIESCNLAIKIKNESSDYVLLSGAEYKKLKHCVLVAVKPLTHIHLPFVQRIRDAEKVGVTEDEDIDKED